MSLNHRIKSFRLIGPETFLRRCFFLHFKTSLAVIFAFLVQHSSPPALFKLVMRDVKSSFLCPGVQCSCLYACVLTSMYHLESHLKLARCYGNVVQLDLCVHIYARKCVCKCACVNVHEYSSAHKIFSDLALRPWWDHCSQLSLQLLEVRAE